MYYSGKQLHNAKVNFTEILKTAVGNRKFIRGIAYVIKADMEDENIFHEALQRIGFEVRMKELQVFYGGAKKGDWDVGIAMDIMRLAPKLDVVVLVSGDGDFMDLLEHVQSLGCRTEVISFRKTTSSRLLGVAHEFTDLDKDKKYLIPLKGRKNTDFKSHTKGNHPVKNTQNKNVQLKPKPGALVKAVPAPKPVPTVKEAQSKKVPQKKTRQEETKKKEEESKSKKPSQKRQSKSSQSKQQSKSSQPKRSQARQQSRSSQSKPLQSRSSQTVQKKQSEKQSEKPSQATNEIDAINAAIDD